MASYKKKNNHKDDNQSDKSQTSKENIQPQNDSTEQKKAEKTPPDYPSSSIILDTMKSEYDYELKRITKTDTKVNLGITLCSAMFLFIVKFFDFSELTKMLNDDISLQLPFNFYFTFWIVMTVAYAGAFVFLFLSIKSRPYSQICTDKLIRQDLHKTSSGVSEVFIAGSYSNATNKRYKI